MNSWIAFAERVYCMLLLLYPADYRRDYGRLMQQIFRDVSRDKYRRYGTLKMMFWWCKTLLDLVLTVIEQRRKAKLTMSKSTFVQLTGILLIIGSGFGMLAAFSQFQPDDHHTYYGIYQMLILLSVPGFLFVGLGCIGLGLRYSQIFGTMGQWTLYLTGIGAWVMGVGLVIASISDWQWQVWLAGGILHGLALAAFGLMHLRKPTLPIFRALPLQMALGWLVFILGVLQTSSQTANNALSFLFMFGMALGWLGIGQILHRQQHETLPATA